MVVGCSGTGRSVPCAGRLSQSIIEATTTDTALGDKAISALDQQFLEAANVLGISDDCIGGAAPRTSLGSQRSVIVPLRITDREAQSASAG